MFGFHWNVPEEYLLLTRNRFEYLDFPFTRALLSRKFCVILVNNIIIVSLSFQSAILAMVSNCLIERSNACRGYRKKVGNWVRRLSEFWPLANLVMFETGLADGSSLSELIVLFTVEISNCSYPPIFSVKRLITLMCGGGGCNCNVNWFYYGYGFPVSISVFNWSQSLSSRSWWFLKIVCELN